MSKTALLIDFCPRTRIVVDVPEGISTAEWLENQENWDNLAKTAREKMAEELPNYLNGENMEWDFDFECPFGTFKSDNE